MSISIRFSASPALLPPSTWRDDMSDFPFQIRRGHSLGIFDCHYGNSRGVIQIADQNKISQSSLSQGIQRSQPESVCIQILCWSWLFMSESDVIFQQFHQTTRSTVDTPALSALVHWAVMSKFPIWRITPGKLIRFVYLLKTTQIVLRITWLADQGPAAWPGIVRTLHTELYILNTEARVRASHYSQDDN